MTTQQPVLAAIDFTDASDEALRQAHAEALRRHTGLVVCHVLPESFRVRVLFPHEAGVDLPAQAALESQARDVMRARIDDVLGPTAVPVTLEVDAGSPHAGILDVADRVLAGLIVTGPGPRPRASRARRTFPVLVARPSPARGPVLGATDFSTAALPALHAAAELAAAAADPLIVMHCLDVEPTAAMVATSAGGMVPMPFMPEVMLQEMTAQATERLEEALASFGVPGRVLVLLAPAGSRHRRCRLRRACHPGGRWHSRTRRFRATAHGQRRRVRGLARSVLGADRAPHARAGRREGDCPRGGSAAQSGRGCPGITARDVEPEPSGRVLPPVRFFPFGGVRQPATGPCGAASGLS